MPQSVFFYLQIIFFFETLNKVLRIDTLQQFEFNYLIINDILDKIQTKIHELL